MRNQKNSMKEPSLALPAPAWHTCIPWPRWDHRTACRMFETRLALMKDVELLEAAEGHDEWTRFFMAETVTRGFERASVLMSGEEVGEAIGREMAGRWRLLLGNCRDFVRELEGADGRDGRDGLNGPLGTRGGGL